MMFFGFILFLLLLYFIFRTPMYARQSGDWHSMWHDRGPMHMHDGKWDAESNKAREILDERYVKGEIGDEEYKAKKANLA